MAEALNYGWRVCATGMCFAVFGIGGLAMRFIAFPVLRVVAPARDVRRDRARELIHVLLSAFVQLMRIVGVMSYEVHGVERLQRRGQLLLANHPSLIDVVLLMSLVRNADCIVKEAANPTRGSVRMAEFLRTTARGSSRTPSSRCAKAAISWSSPKARARRRPVRCACSGARLTSPCAVASTSRPL
jgi:hypothetical protein